MLKVDRISSGYKDDFDILHDVSICVDEKEIVSIIGPNGAGKSTLLKTIMGLVKCRKGDIYFDGERITGAKPSEIVRKGIGYVPQAENVFPSLTALENIEMGAFVRKDDYDNALHDVFDLFPQLKGFLSQKAGLLSGGQQKMVAVGRALMIKPKILLLDEPFARLTPLLVKKLCEQLKIVNEMGVTLLIVEQNMVRVLQFSERAYLLRVGRVQYEGPSNKLLEEGNWSELLFGVK